MRTRILVLALLAPGGCICWSDPESCVTTRNLASGSQICHDVGGLECVDLVTDAPDPPPEPESCASGGSYADTSCDDRGFTQECSGGYFVRPGDGC